MSHAAINCKVKLIHDGETLEMRRFTLEDSSFASHFDLLKEKLRAVFPQLRGAAFKVSWIDADNDDITIANDEDLITAMMEMNGVKLLQVHVNNNSPSEGIDGHFEDANDEPAAESPLFRRQNIICDVCDNNITRYRYKCVQCPDYDLCMNCEHAGHHSHHIMMRLADLELPRFFPKVIGHFSRTARKAAHHAAKEAHRAAKISARTAQATAERCHRRFHSFRGDRARNENRSNNADSQNNNTTSGSACPMMDTGLIIDLAESFLGPIVKGVSTSMGQQTGTANPTSASESQSAQQQATSSQKTAPQASQQEPTPSQANAPQSGQTPIGVDIIGNVLQNIFSALNGQGATPASTTCSTPTPSATQTQTEMQVDQDEVQPVVTSHQPTHSQSAENLAIHRNPSTSSAPASIIDRESGWTILPNEPTSSIPVQESAPIASAPQSVPVASAISAEQQQIPASIPPGPYADALWQLRKMGFRDDAYLMPLLQRYNGNIGFVVNHLFESNSTKK